MKASEIITEKWSVNRNPPPFNGTLKNIIALELSEDGELPSGLAFFPANQESRATLAAAAPELFNALAQCESTLAAFLPNHPAGPLARKVLEKAAS